MFEIKFLKNLMHVALKAFFQAVINKYSISFCRIELNCTIFSKNVKLITNRLIILDNQKVIDNWNSTFKNMNNYISLLKEWVSEFHTVEQFYLLNYLAQIRLFEATTNKIPNVARNYFSRKAITFAKTAF